MDLTHMGWTLRLHCFEQQTLRGDGELLAAHLAVSAGLTCEVRSFAQAGTGLVWQVMDRLDAVLQSRLQRPNISYGWVGHATEA